MAWPRGFSGGGASAGMGGAIFNRGGTVTATGVTFADNTAQGGEGGTSDVGGGGVGGGGVGAGPGGGPNGGTGAVAGDGGFGGGGGTSNGGLGGDGGFGGGGGYGGTTGGVGGFGGGGGYSASDGALGGFGGGSGAVTGGGGGAGMGGALFNYHGTVALTNSTLSGNTAAGGNGAGADADPGSGFGGAVFNYNGALTARNSTLSGNTAAQGGRNAYVLGDGAGNTAEYTITNTILSQADNSVVDLVIAVNAGGTTTDGGSGFNLYSNQGAGVPGLSNIIANPFLGPLADNGGPTPTMALEPFSPAIDVGDNALAAGLTNDQRGFPFGRIVEGPDADDLAEVDIGAVEFRFIPTFDLVVTTTADELDDDLTNAADLSLREAVFIANARPGPDTITFDVSLAGQTITLTAVGHVPSGQTALGITTDVTVSGPTGADGVTLAGGGPTSNLRAFYVAPTGSLTLERLTLRDFRVQGGDGGGGGGGGAGLGGAIFNAGSSACSPAP